MTPSARTASAYRAPAWLPGAHLQTIYPAVVAPRPSPSYRRERWSTPDGDFVDVDYAGAASAGDTPTLVLFHGLEGCSQSHYARALGAAASARGWRIAIPHFRGCSGEINRAPRAYHSGDSDEIDWILRRFAAGAGAPLYAVGVSLGGNALAKWLGERGEDAARVVRAAVAVSPPQDLHASAAALTRGFNRIYTANFLKTLKRKSLAKLAQYPGLFDRSRMLAATSFFEFDDAVTAPLHGFRGCLDYWRRSACKPLLAGVRTPLLVINARNDPFLPAAHLARPDQVARDVVLEYPDTGGHAGFLEAGFPGRDWLSGRVLAFLDGHG